MGMRQKSTEAEYIIQSRIKIWLGKNKYAGLSYCE